MADTNTTAQATESVLSSIAGKIAVYVGSMTALIASLDINTIGVIGGLLIAAIGLVVKYYTDMHSRKVMSQERDAKVALIAAQRAAIEQDQGRKIEEHALKAELVNLKLQAIRRQLDIPTIDVPLDSGYEDAFKNSDVLGLDDLK